MFFLITVAVLLIIVFVLIFKGRSSATTGKAKANPVDTTEGFTEVSISEFKARYGHSAVVPWEIFCMLDNAEFSGQKSVSIPSSCLKEIESNFVLDIERNEHIKRCAERNNKGIELEKSGDIIGAISIYEENITDTHLATHSYDRLMIIYRRLKDYSNELRVIEYAISRFSAGNNIRYSKDIARWEQRKLKVQSLLDKAK